MSRLDLDPLVKRVTSYILAHPYERDVWEKAPAITGILRWDDDKAIAAVKGWVDRAVDVQSSRGYPTTTTIELPKGQFVFSPTPRCPRPGYCVLAFYERNKRTAHRRAIFMRKR